MARQSTPTDGAFIITLDGYDTDTATPEQCAFHSGFDYPKIKEANEVYIEVSWTTAFPVGRTNILTRTFDDNGYDHSHVAWLNLDSVVSGVRPNLYGLLPVWLNPYHSMESYIDGDEFKIDFVNTAASSVDFGSFTFEVKYQIWDNEVGV